MSFTVSVISDTADPGTRCCYIRPFAHPLFKLSFLFMFWNCMQDVICAALQPVNRFSKNIPFVTLLKINKSIKVWFDLQLLGLWCHCCRRSLSVGSSNIQLSPLLCSPEHRSLSLFPQGINGHRMYSMSSFSVFFVKITLIKPLYFLLK